MSESLSEFCRRVAGGTYDETQRFFGVARKDVVCIQRRPSVGPCLDLRAQPSCGRQHNLRLAPLDCEYVSFGAEQNWLLGLESCGPSKRRRHCRRRNNKVCTMGGSRRLSLGSGKHTVQKNGGGDVVSFPCVR